MRVSDGSGDGHTAYPSGLMRGIGEWEVGAGEGGCWRCGCEVGWVQTRRLGKVVELLGIIEAMGWDGEHGFGGLAKVGRGVQLLPIAFQRYFVYSILICL
jgi:hypothetical protein